MTSPSTLSTSTRSGSGAHSRSLRHVSAGCTHVGGRANNEDAFLVRSDLGLFVVCDGMGGNVGGEVASEAAVTAVERIFDQQASDEEITLPMMPARRHDHPRAELLDVATRVADAAIRERQTRRLQGMGTTIAAVAIAGDDAVIAHVGDSRVYLVRQGAARQLTTDHSLYEEMRALGGSHLPAIEDFAYPHVITRALGCGPSSQADLRIVGLQDGDRLVLCSDGLTEKLDDSVIGRIALGGSPRQAANTLVEIAVDAGARDNVTALVVAISKA